MVCTINHHFCKDRCGDPFPILAKTQKSPPLSFPEKIGAVTLSDFGLMVELVKIHNGSMNMKSNKAVVESLLKTYEINREIVNRTYDSSSSSSSRYE